MNQSKKGLINKVSSGNSSNNNSKLSAADQYMNSFSLFDPVVPSSSSSLVTNNSNNGVNSSLGVTTPLKDKEKVQFLNISLKHTL